MGIVLEGNVRSFVVVLGGNERVSSIPLQEYDLFSFPISKEQDLSQKCSAWKVLGIGLSMLGGIERGGFGWGGPFLSLRVAYIPNLSLLQTLKSFE